MACLGLHHVTAIAGPARRNVDFYTRVLGLRLVKKTVNFDDPGTYHLYFGDEAGSPGTILTFFPWDHAAPGRVGPGETEETSFRIPASSVGFWLDRLSSLGIAHDVPARRFGETVIGLRDPDGMRLALVAVAGIEASAAWSVGDIPADAAIRGFRGVTLLLDDPAPTAAILADVFGYREVAREEGVIRMATSEGGAGVIDLRAAGRGPVRGRSGAGSVHHIAFRAEDDAAQEAMVRRLAEHHGIRTTEQKDRNYFRSVYFREPGHVLFEIATDIPGFAADEDPASLGEALKLPAFLEPHRERIEANLPSLD